MTCSHSFGTSSVHTQVNKRSSDSVSSTSMIVKGNSSLGSMKTRFRRGMGLPLEGCADRLGSGSPPLPLVGDLDDVLNADAAVTAGG
jgi:hypothetical protein